MNDLVKSNTDLNNKLESIYLNYLIGGNLKFEKKNLNFFYWIAALRTTVENLNNELEGIF